MEESGEYNASTDPVGAIYDGIVDRMSLTAFRSLVKGYNYHERRKEAITLYEIAELLGVSAPNDLIPDSFENRPLLPMFLVIDDCKDKVQIYIGFEGNSRRVEGFDSFAGLSIYEARQRDKVKILLAGSLHLFVKDGNFILPKNVRRRTLITPFAILTT